MVTGNDPPFNPYIFQSDALIAAGFINGFEVIGVVGRKKSYSTGIYYFSM
jgi:hypothetical protein